MHIVDRIVEQNLGVYRASPTRLLEDVMQEAQTASDYRGRLAYELLQNADDAMEGDASGRDYVKFLLTDDALWMANNGRPLSDADVQGLCGLGASSKIDAAGNKRASIGHKGLGFKSVLEITERPAAMSQGLAFELSEDIARNHVSELFDELEREVPDSLPVMRFPQLLANEPDEWRMLSQQGFTTAFRFPFKPEITPESQLRLADALLGLPLTTVLFLKHLDQVEVEVATRVRTETRSWRLQREVREGGAWREVPGLTESGMFRVGVVSSEDERGLFLLAHNSDVEIGDQRSGLSGPAWEGVTVSEVSVAVLDPEGALDEMPQDWRHFHVFLPTEEPSPYPILVNGAFTTDLSRQSVRVNEDDERDYNLHLIGQAAALFVNQVLPELVHHGMDHVLGVLERDTGLESAAARALHSAVAAEISEVPLLPAENGSSLSLNAAVFPPASLNQEGSEYRSLLVQDAGWDGRKFPAASVCGGRWSTVGADHGALALEAADAVSALADQLDPVSASAIEHVSGGFELDPVLEVCSSLYLSAPREDQPEVGKRARSESLFPTFRNPDGTFERVSLEGTTAFYPPRSAKHHLPLSGLQFMSHAVCWGALGINERSEYLGDRLRTWTLLFEVQEFRFEEVMRAAVLPHLRMQDPGVAEATRDELESIEALTAICQLAGRFPKPDRPLRYQRLGSDRALFNLSRLPVPCRGTEDGAIQWTPAYRAYFGREWIGEDSVETISDALAEHDSSRELHLPFLISPNYFEGRLQDLAEEELIDESVPDDDEVDIDEDFDQSLESDELSAWITFLKWIGVNASLRPVHFHDVEDRDSGWLSTKGVAQPQGWAFRELGDVWEKYRSNLVERDRRLTDDGHVPYFYELHDLEGLVTVLAAAERDPSGRIGGALLDHLVRHWETLETFAEATIALVKAGLYPSQRTRPPKAKDDEIVHSGDNFWVFRLKNHSYFPTSHGPRRPDQTWLKSEDIERRFAGRARRAEDLVPVFEPGVDIPGRHVIDVCARLGVRTALTPATFTLEDARLLCRRLESLVSEPPSREVLREVVRPAYRELFELLSGRSGDDTLKGVLRDEPLLVGMNGQYTFRPAHEVLYAGTPGFLQRSGLHDQIPTFVLEAESSANAPLTRLFEARPLEASIEWVPDPGESPFDEEESLAFRHGLEDLMPFLLARVRVERRTQDGRVLRAFADCAEAVSELGLHCRLDGKAYSVGNSREYYVRNGTRPEPMQVFIQWDGPPWPPEQDEAQRLAMALADALEVNLVEAFLALIQSQGHQRRRLLEIAGAIGFLDEAVLGDGGPEDDGDTGGKGGGDIKTPDPLTAPTDEEPADIEDHRGPAPAPVELVKFEDLWIEGEPMLVFGDAGQHPDRVGSTGRSPGEHGEAFNRAAPGTDLVSLDSLGMRIAMAYEVNRLTRRGGGSVVVLPGGLSHPDSVHLVVDVSTPAAIRRAAAQSPIAKAAFDSLQGMGISQVHPGFDILTVADGQVDRLIELKSSAVDARVQAMTWNEWKSARNSDIREQFWLYLVGNLRADLEGPPYLRAIKDPFGSLYSEEVSEERVSRAVQLRVREFEEAEQLVLVPGHQSISDR